MFDLIQFQFPELWLLAIPLFFVYRKVGYVRGVTGWLRAIVLLLLLAALTGPVINVGGRGIDLVIVADRSRSMTAEDQRNIQELIQNLENNRADGDRIGLVTFGNRAEIEHHLRAMGNLGDFTKVVNEDGSDLNDALLTALNLVDPNRPARILVLSDGESNGASPLTAGRRARELGVPIDFRKYDRVRVGDVAVESVLLPETVSPREPFQFSAWVHADRVTTATVRMLRDGQEFTRVEHDFTPGMNRLVFRDLLEAGGSYKYSVELDLQDDPIAENNKGAGVITVDAGPRVLVLNNDGQPGNLTRILDAGQIPYDLFAAKEHPLTQDSLDRYRAVIIENVPAGDFGRLKMERLAQFVEDLGGGLLLTGGQRSFGTGGYFKSPIDEILPVSMELREEHRKTQIAIAIALDRSGSMSMPVAGGKTKMDLANLGTAECVKLLSPGDSVAVIAVDSAPHIIQPLTSVEDKTAIISRIKKIESMGGGIYVYEALVAAVLQLNAAPQATKHIILFSDAQDSEEPGKYKDLLKKAQAAGITCSVIGLGTKADVDAKLLEDIAKLGNGQCMFTTDPKELPRLFTEDTMSVARSTFIQPEEGQTIAGAMLPEIRLMGELSSGDFPAVGGYNLSYARPDATIGVQSVDEYNAPWSAFWYKGLGRAVALCIEVDGQFTGPFGKWDSYADFLITHTRWLLSGDSKPGTVFTQMKRDGQDAVINVELDPESPIAQSTEPPELVVVPPGSERAEAFTPDFIWTGPNTLQARFRMDREGTYRTLVKSSDSGSDPGTFARGPTITLPYSPEFMPRHNRLSGSATLGAVADLSGGLERVDVLEVLEDPPRAAKTVSLLSWLFSAGLVLLVIEIAGRRLSLWERVAWQMSKDQRESEGEERKASWLPKWRMRSKQKTPPAVTPSTSASKPKVKEKPKVDVFEQAKKRAGKRLK